MYYLLQEYKSVNPQSYTLSSGRGPGPLHIFSSVTLTTSLYTLLSSRYLLSTYWMADTGDTRGSEAVGQSPTWQQGTFLFLL